MNGKLYGVGVGPGDPELVTLKAARLIAGCDRLAFPSSGDRVAYTIACGAVPQAAQKPVLELELPMTRDTQALEYSRQQAAEQLAACLEQGEQVVFLTIGDVSIYSTYTYLQTLVRRMGYAVEMVPGVPSFCAVAARLGAPLVEGGTPLHLLPASYAGTEQALDWPGTKVLMKSGRSLEQVAQALHRRGLGDKTQAVEQCGLPGEQVYGCLEALEGQAHYLTTLVVTD